MRPRRVCEYISWENLDRPSDCGCRRPQSTHVDDTFQAQATATVLPRWNATPLSHSEEYRNTTDATAMSAVAVHPVSFRRLEMQNLPMTSVRAPSSITIAMTGTDTIPLSSAAHTSAFMGPIRRRLAIAPSVIASAIEV